MYTINDHITVPTTLEKAWEFFSNPHNLSKITPPSLGFTVTSKPPPKIYPGLAITYRVSPLFGIPTKWVSEISHVVEGKMFVDIQLYGPYKVWHHQHHFEEVPGGVRCTDIVHYVLPFHPLSSPVHALLVRPQLNDIFKYRKTALQEIFGELKV